MMEEEVLSRLVQRIGRVNLSFRKEEAGSSSTTRPHTAVSIRQFLAKQGIPEFHQTPDFFLFPKIKSMLKGRRFEDTEDIKRHVTKELLALHAN
jgi:hypothetical protein